MLQRIRGAIIPDEPSRQKAAQDSLSRSNSNRRPAVRPRRESATPTRGPDPTEFEPEFAIGDDDASTRSGTPRPEPTTAPEGTTSGDSVATKGPGDAAGKETASVAGDGVLPTDLSTEIRVKLRRLDKLEPRYQELLRAYRIAHGRVLSIEPFEAALREMTPLTSIGDPKALTEYLNQISLKGDMVLDELKRVTGDRDEYRKRFEEAEKSTKAALDELENLKKRQSVEVISNGSGGATDKGKGLALDTSAVANHAIESPLKSPTGSSVSRTTSIPGISLFSPKARAPKSPPAKEENEEFFSFDNEMPRLESELHEKQEEAENLKSQVEALKRNLSVARESTEGMVRNLESATRELEGLRDNKVKHEAELESLKSAKNAETDSLQTKLARADTALKELETQLKEKTGELEQLRQQVAQAENGNDHSELATKLAEMEKKEKLDEKRLGIMDGLVTTLRSQAKNTEATVSTLTDDLAKKTVSCERLQRVVDFVDKGLNRSDLWRDTREKVACGEIITADIHGLLLEARGDGVSAELNKAEPELDTQSLGSGAGRKRKNKKKKGGKGGDDSKKSLAPTPRPENRLLEDESNAVHDLEQTVEELKSQFANKDAAIERLYAKLKGEDGLKEEIESLRDDLLQLGQDNVGAKDQIKELLTEKVDFEQKISTLEKEVLDLQAYNASSSADSEKANRDLMTEFEDLKARSAALQMDLFAAQQLAAARFKDLTDLRETLQKVQPELRNLRAESAELKAAKEELRGKTIELKNLEGKHDDLRAELKRLKTTIADREAEVKSLNQRLRQETDNCLKAQEALSVAQSDLRYSETKKQEALETNEKTTKDLSDAQEDLKTSHARLREVEEQVTQLTRDIEGLREETQLKTAQHSSAQSLMNSMRDQTSEMAMQMKEARERCESLEEELADVHRLLSERSREGETMRRLLNDIENRSEARVREFKERLEAAIEERDRAEDEASVAGRRRAREMEELKIKARETERALKRAEEDKGELEYAQRDWKRKREELEAQLEHSTEELKAIHQAMAQLQDILDEREKQARDMEKEKAELRRSVEETNNRLEKLRRSNKALTDEVRSAQNARRRGLDSDNQSSRSSIDSPGRKGVISPPPREQNTPVSSVEAPASAIDYIYLKNVLLQFLEQRDKNYQKQLIPVLGMLLHFDRTDEQKWMSAVLSR